MLLLRMNDEAFISLLFILKSVIVVVAYRENVK